MLLFAVCEAHEDFPCFTPDLSHPNKLTHMWYQHELQFDSWYLRFNVANEYREPQPGDKIPNYPYKRRLIDLPDLFDDNTLDGPAKRRYYAKFYTYPTYPLGALRPDSLAGLWEF